jgi:hypothetical protein
MVRYHTIESFPSKGVLESVHGDIPTPATYQSARGEQDELNAAIRLKPVEDQVAIQPRFDGLLSYGGAVTYGDSLPLAIDAMQIKITRPIRYDGKRNYAVAAYSGERHYDGTLSYLEGETYAGDKEEMI